MKQNLPLEIFKISCSNIISLIFGDYEILIKGSLPGGKEILLNNVVSTSGLIVSDDLQDDGKKQKSLQLLKLITRTSPIVCADLFPG